MPENRLTWVSLFMVLRRTERFNLTFQLRKDRLHISNAGPGEGLIFFGNVILPFVDDFPKDNELYSIMTTKLGETGKGENEHE